MLVSLTFLFAFAAAQTANYQIVYSYPIGDTNCNNPNGIVVTNFGGFCTETPCQCLAGYGCSKIQCNRTSVPADPPNAIVYAQYVGTSCSGVVQTYSAQTSGTCLRTSVSSNTSTKIICDGQFYQQTWSNSATCSGNPTTTSQKFSFSGSRCFTPTGGSGAYYIKCGGVCIHKDTVIQYQGEQITLASLSASENPVCAVPHVLTMNGVKIHTTCPGELRLTHRHLVMTPDGWKEAGSLQRGDMLFSKVHSLTAECQITNIETETDQEYFGLNCEDSHIEANGYWISTFGHIHKVPAMWMKVMSKIIGVSAASSVGDTLGNWFSGLWN
jgi:hypothetical protein